MRRSAEDSVPSQVLSKRDALGLRVVSSAVVLTAVVATVTWAPAVVGVAAAVVAATTCMELGALLSRGRRSAGRVATVVAALVVLSATFGAVVLAWTLLAGVGVMALAVQGPAWSRVRTVLPVVWVGLPLGLAVVLSDSESGRLLLVLGLLLLCVFESAAYVCGQRWGRRRIAPRISPGKTVEGTAAGVLATVAAAGFPWLVDVVDASTAASSALVVCVFGFVGDLAGSAVKRAASVKDSGSLVPGHGGMLDYVDGFLFVAPMVFVLHLLPPTLGGSP
ncbi:phosphatidate cytidylyltransferase [Streptomyces peucetius]|uniref:Phosphatidate cytidylyltransferase n=1 Tax=Streptomyces peucetius TaxID=1950 RepID=A0ABY6I253_STRPE|nr:phosphatidate cytidylyltransferase [Streptomyces peucetius]UYQ60064.1 phosphatidate cytidylyltransferase [Streptomyces peucetius]